MQTGLQVSCLCWATSTRGPVRISCAVLPEKLLRTPAAAAVARAGARRRVSILIEAACNRTLPNIVLGCTTMWLCAHPCIAAWRKNEGCHVYETLERSVGRKRPSHSHLQSFQSLLIAMQQSIDGVSPQKAAGDEGARVGGLSQAPAALMAPTQYCAILSQPREAAREQGACVDLLTMTLCAAFRGGRYEQAFERYSAALEEGEEPVPTLCNRSLTALKLGRHPAAGSTAASVCSSASHATWPPPPHHWPLAGRPEEALQDAEAALQLLARARARAGAGAGAGQLAKAVHRKAEALAALGQLLEAVRAYRQGLAECPGSLEMHAGLRLAAEELPVSWLAKVGWRDIWRRFCHALFIP